MALLVNNCPICGRRTEHQFDRHPDPQFSVCAECGHATPMPPPPDLYEVTFTNAADPAAGPGAGEYRLSAIMAGESPAAVLDWAIRWALSFMDRRGGLPPNGVRVSAEELRRRAAVERVDPAEPDAGPGPAGDDK